MARSKRIALGAATVAFVPLVVACNAIIGLSDFDKGQCAGARCPDDGGFADVILDGGGQGDGSDVFAPDARGADPVSWAKWPMPYYGEGGLGQPLPSPPLVANGAVVTDTVTNLSWSTSVVAGDFTASQVEAACKTLGNGPWRAPKRIELVTLLDYSRGVPFVDSAKFTDLKNYTVWTTSEVRPFVGGPKQPYWVVSFGTGSVEPLSGDLSAKVLCVRAK
jgi:hypothetical protein